MSQILKDGQAVRIEPSSASCRVARLLGSGGQGEVYQAVVNGKAVALKWYFPSSATPAQKTALEMIIRSGPPNEKFLWPAELAVASGVPGFGYIMPLRAAHYRNIVDLMKRRVEPGFRALATAGLELSDSFLQLHTKGLCYRDISFGNVFFDPDTGEVLICDNDNVTVDRQPMSGVMGTPRFMAPEVVRGEAAPSTQTDLFSLAVLLFYMLMIHHPLEGKKEISIKCMDLPAMNKLYGFEPLFIFDPHDHSNAPDPRYHRNALEFWPVYPTFLRRLFTRAFTTGLHDPDARVRESEWRGVMVRLRDAILYCSCGMENFYDNEALQASQGKPGLCWSCHRELKLPPRIRFGKSVVMLNYNTRLYSHHLDDMLLYDFSQPQVEVVHQPGEPQAWGLKNLSDKTWKATTAGGAVLTVEPGRSLPLAAGLRINFGKVEGEIRV